VVTSVRAAKMRRVADSVVTTGSYDADQGQVWRDVDRHLEVTGVHSMTAAYADAAEQQTERIERQLATLQPAADQRGIAVVRAGVLMTLDLFASPSLYARAWPALGRGLLADADTRRPQPALPHSLRSLPGSEWRGWHDPVAVVTAALAAVAGAQRVRQDSPGGGHTLHGRAGEHAFGAVAGGGTGYHCVVAG
jgi:hypothetical protein